jgi:peptidoglycan/LPS O-acetylase OafA/YrhL
VPATATTPGAQTRVTREEHIVPLDGLRGLAVLMVMFGHFW